MQFEPVKLPDRMSNNQRINAENINEEERKLNRNLLENVFWGKDDCE